MTASVPEVDFSKAHEMQPYLTEPEQMYVGAPGKHGYLKLRFALDSTGKSILREIDRRVPLIAQQELYFDEELPGMPCLYILSSGGPNVDGDRYQQDIIVEKDAMGWISTGAATKLAEMKFNYSGMIQNITLDEGAYLEFMPEPVFPCRHTRFICDTKLTVHPTATVLYSEIYMSGRKYYGKGEMFDYDILSVHSHGHRPDGTPLFNEKFIIEPSKLHPQQLGVMGNYEIFANVIVMAPKEVFEKVYAEVTPRIDRENGIATGITTLPNDAGLLFKVLGSNTGKIKKEVRQFASKVRMAVKGKPLPEEFPWR
ncbi:MAG: urease accessory protein UreD [Bacteroidales bacterium]|nr:urease accessory protein UreD [Bacteroidales bacterium]MBD5206115.1 urease accessory protein UreD [Bacteroidales bacterium]MBD5223578.1 urease accessory protein UreD [Bacteroidales bacterium]MBD5302558.1 urease accessory protein UreD [Bacteroides sp.]MBD5348779.1 urease accessory protein UreD [Bacteroides sp.]